MNPADLAWLILLLPLISAVVITLFTQRDGPLSAKLSITAIVLSFVLTAALFLAFGESRAVDTTALDWLSVGDLKIELGLRLDALSWLMLFIVTGVGGL